MFDIQHLYKTFDEHPILEDVSLSVQPKEIVALIGDNGSGKTTFLTIISGAMEPDEGKIVLSGVIGYVPQQLTSDNSINNQFSPATPRWVIDRALERVGLGGISPERTIDSLSGGQKTRLLFARILAQENEPTLLLLDEPTNNIDSEGLVWLEKFITSFDGAIIIASHDRAFINRVATRVIELEHGHLTSYEGNYDSYKKEKERTYQAQLDEYEHYSHEKKRLTRLRQQKIQSAQHVSTERYDRTKGVPKMDFNASRNKSEKNFGKQAKALESRLGQLAEVKSPVQTKSYRVTVDGEVSHGKLILRLNNVSWSYTSPLFTNFQLEIRGNERVHIAGQNGSGKTTLLKIAAGILVPDIGTVEVGVAVSVGYFSQDVDGLDYGVSGFENLYKVEDDRTVIYSKARSLGLTEKDLKQLPSLLSRGQQAKLSFAKLLLEKHNLLILDEPTNHLDIATRERIEAALQEYTGALLVASHDEYFLQEIGVARLIEL